MIKNWKETSNWIIKIINTEDEFIDFLQEMQNEEKQFIYRGQSNRNLKEDGTLDVIFEEWDLESSLIRKIKKEFKYTKKEEKFDEIINIDNIYAHLIGRTFESIEYFKERFPNKSNLNILAELQHFGIPTALIDFTKDFFQSLFFAFNNENKFSQDGKEGHVNLFRIEVHKINKILYDIKQETAFGGLLNLYECPLDIKRGLSQKSLFILDRFIYGNVEVIQINYKMSKYILDFLKKKFINYEYVFPDLEGVYKQFENFNESSLMQKGNVFFELKRYKESIEKYEEAIEKYEEIIQQKILQNEKTDFIYMNIEICFFNLGNVLNKLKKYEEAIEKYKKYEEYEKQIEEDIKKNNINYIRPNIYYNWGCTLEDLILITKDLNKKEKYKLEAIKKYKKAIHIDPGHSKAKNNLNIILQTM